MIDPENSFLMLAAVSSIVAFGFVSERTALGRRLSGAVIVLLLSAALANAGLLPKAAPLYDSIWSVGVPLAVALYLLKADIVGIAREGGSVLIAFIAGVIGVVAGAFVGALFFDLGVEEAALAAVFSATYSGGSLNFAAVAEALSFRDEALLAAAVAVDNVMGIGFFAFLSLAGGAVAFRRGFAARAEQLTEENQSGSSVSDVPRFDGGDFAFTIFVAAFICALGGLVANLVGYSQYRILFITTFAISFAAIAKPLWPRLGGAEVLATVFMYAFFVMLGAGAGVREMLDAPVMILPFVLLIFVTHFGAVLLAAKLFKLNYGEIIVASGACIGGPPIAIAYAVLFGWRSLAGPAIGVGVLGYALGNFVGIGVHSVLSAGAG